MTKGNNPGLGGRGKLAPYKTTHFRIPTALKPIVMEMASEYRELVDEYEVDDPALVSAVVSAIASEEEEEDEEDCENTEELSKMSFQIKSLEIQLNFLQQENKELTEQLSSKERYNNTLQSELEKFQNVSQVVLLLENALLLKANAGGAIKEKIKEALHLIK